MIQKKERPVASLDINRLKLMDTTPINDGSSNPTSPRLYDAPGGWGQCNGTTC